VPTLPLPPVEPVGVIERSSKQAYDTGKSLQVEVDGRTALAAEIQRDTPSTGVRSVVIRFQSSPRKNNVFFSENRLDKECRSGDALTERAMTNRDPHWLRQRLVPNLATQSSAHLIHDHAEPLA